MNHDFSARLSVFLRQRRRDTPRARGLWLCWWNRGNDAFADYDADDVSTLAVPIRRPTCRSFLVSETALRTAGRLPGT